MKLHRIVSKLFGNKKTNRPEIQFQLTGLKEDEHDHRDYVQAPEPISGLPKSASITPLPPIRNQLNIGSCASHAIIGAAETLIMQKYPNLFLEGSELYHYYFARAMAGTLPQDCGMSMRDACKTLFDYGYAPEVTWPYDTSKFNIKPPLTAQWMSKIFTFALYQRLITIDQIKQSIVHNIPVVFGVKVYDSFYTVKSTYNPSGRYVGGHAQEIVSYDDDSGIVTIRNSWGQNWGRQGYYYMSYNDLMTYGFDFWQIVPKQ